MPIKTEDLHGNAPDSSRVVLLLIDVINDFEFEGGETLLELSMPVAEQIASLKERACQLGIPVVYVNDNLGRGAPTSIKSSRIAWMTESAASHSFDCCGQGNRITSS